MNGRATTWGVFKAYAVFLNRGAAGVLKGQPIRILKSNENLERNVVKQATSPSIFHFYAKTRIENLVRKPVI